MPQAALGDQHTTAKGGCPQGARGDQRATAKSGRGPLGSEEPMFIDLSTSLQLCFLTLPNLNQLVVAVRLALLLSPLGAHNNNS